MHGNIKEFILSEVEQEPHDLVKRVSSHFGISQQAVSLHIRQLIQVGLIEKLGDKRGVYYQLSSASTGDSKPFPPSKKMEPPKLSALSYSPLATLDLNPQSEEHLIWENYFQKRVQTLPNHISQILEYGFGEMMNNCIDHAEASTVEIGFELKGNHFCMSLQDNGIGIFQKIKRALQCKTLHESMIHLSKGKFTTDEERHSGEGIFFTSRVFDYFALAANGLLYERIPEDDWTFRSIETDPGTLVGLELNTQTHQKLIDIFQRYTNENHAFDKTEILVELGKNPEERYFARSQAKRILSGLEKFQRIVFDFRRVDAIGQGFADEIFRVWAKIHPHIQLTYQNTNPDVEFMIKKVPVF